MFVIDFAALMVARICFTSKIRDLAIKCFKKSLRLTDLYLIETSITMFLN